MSLKLFMFHYCVNKWRETLFSWCHWDMTLLKRISSSWLNGGGGCIMFRIMIVLKIITEGQVLVSKATVSPHGTFIFVVDVINVIRIFGPRSKIQLDFSPNSHLDQVFFFLLLFIFYCFPWVPHFSSLFSLPPLSPSTTHTFLHFLESSFPLLHQGPTPLSSLLTRKQDFLLGAGTLGYLLRYHSLTSVLSSVGF